MKEMSKYIPPDLDIVKAPPATNPGNKSRLHQGFNLSQNLFTFVCIKGSVCDLFQTRTLWERAANYKRKTLHFAQWRWRIF